MPSPSWENLDDFFSTDEFGLEAIINIQDAGTIVVSGILDDPYLNAELGEYDTDTNDPRLTCKEVDILAVRRGDTAVINDKTYDILNSPESDVLVRKMKE